MENIRLIEAEVKAYEGFPDDVTVRWSWLVAATMLAPTLQDAGSREALERVGSMALEVFKLMKFDVDNA